MAHINDLPTELFVAILLILRSAVGTSPWIRLLLVCRRWHDVACSAPILWSTLAFDQRCSADILGTLLSRSAGLGLKLSMDVHAVDPGELLETLRTHSGRLESLALRFLPSQLDDIRGRLEGISGAVKTLTLHCLTSEAPTFPLNSAAFPSLRSLHAIQVLPRPTGPMPDGITRLELTQIWHAVHSEGDADQWQYDLLSTIGALPGLQHLVLRDALPPCMALEDLSMVAVTLPALRTLELSETIEDLQLFLQYVTIPATARLTIVARVRDAMWEPDVAGVWTAILPDNFRETLPMIPQTRALRLFAGHTAEGPVSLSGNPVAEMGTREAAWAVVLPDCGEILAETVQLALLELPRVVHPSSLVHLELHIAPRILLFDVEWAAVLEGLPRLRTLVVGSLWKAERVVTALYQRGDILPELNLLELCLEEVVVDRQRGPRPPPSETIPRRKIETVAVVQAGGKAEEAPEPYFEGTVIGSMLETTRYEFKYSQCLACHVSGRILHTNERSATPEDSE